MYPLIEIKSIPIEIRLKTTNASLEYTRGTAEMEISRSDKADLDIKSRPIRLQLDTFEQRGGTMPVPPGPAAASMQAAQGPAATAQGITAQLNGPAAYEATSAYSDQGQIMLSARFAQSLNQAARFAAPQEAPEPPQEDETSPFTLNSGLDFEWGEDGQMEIRYEMDKMSFDWKIDKGSFEFTPGDIELIVEQRPSVVIKYMGGPIYVPRSADPNYEPVDVRA